MKICALSDIHGDSELLLLQLRDVMGVIKYKSKGNSNEMLENHNKLMSMPFMNESAITYVTPNSSLNGNDQYITDWNYEWCEENVTVVICGDIIDGFRPDPENMEIKGEFPFEELKILAFLYEMQKSALNKNSSLVILFGNHEIHGMYTKLLTRYTSKFTKNNYIIHNGKNEKRTEMFRPGSYTFKYIIQLQYKLIYKYENFIFVHGQLIYDKSMSLDNFIITTNIAINNELQSIDYKYKNFKQYKKFMKEQHNIDSFIFDFLKLSEGREYSTAESRELICDIAYENDYTIIVGHCINYFHLADKNVCTFTNLFQTNQLREIYTLSDDYLKPYKLTLQSKKDCNIFNNINITFDCSNNTFNSPHLYRIDCGSARGFLDHTFYKNTHNIKMCIEEHFPEINYIFSTVPQSLVLLKQDDHYIPYLYKCTIKNMYLNRTCFTISPQNIEFLSNISSKQLNNEQSGGKIFNNYVVVFYKKSLLNTIKTLYNKEISLNWIPLIFNDNNIVYNISNLVVIPNKSTVTVNGHTFTPKFIYITPNGNKLYNFIDIGFNA